MRRLLSAVLSIAMVFTASIIAYADEGISIGKEATFASANNGVDDKQERLVSFTYNTKRLCPDCGEVLSFNRDFIIEDLLGERTFYGNPTGLGNIYKGKENVDYYGTFYSVTPQIDVYCHYLNVPLTVVDHLQMHGYDKNDQLELKEIGDSYLSNYQYQSKENHYEYDNNELNDERVKISKSAFTYNKKNQRPTVEVVINGKKLSAKTDYTVTYPKKSKSVGTYKIVVKGKGKYKGTVAKKYQITQGKLKLGKPTVKKIKKGNKTQIYTKPSGNYEATTYYFRIANDKDCTNLLVGKTKTKLTKKKIAVYGKLTKGKTYYLQVCAAKGKYSTEWSSPVAIKGK